MSFSKTGGWLQVCGQKLFGTFVREVCVRVGRREDYPLNLTVTVGCRRVVPDAAMDMSMVYQLYMSKDDALLYLTHG